MDLKALFIIPLKGGFTKTLRIMRLTAILILAACLQVSAKGYSQKITLTEKHVPVEKILQKIRAQTGYDFFYNLKTLELAGKVSVNVQEASITKTLDACFKNTPLTYTITDKIIVINQTSPPAPLLPSEETSHLPQLPIDVSGTVTGDDGAVVEGATVKVKGSGKVTITDRNGVFSLKGVPADAVLQVSHIGYAAREISLDGKTFIVIRLNLSSDKLDDMVVVAYAQQKKSTLTGSVSQINSDQIKQAPPLNISNVLAGRLPGLIVTQPFGRPGADDATINVRGISTTGSNAPLIIVDGIERSFTTMDPNEIESISVLKDASSAAVYGARAANGVILVMTKRGRQGKPVISYEGNVSQNSNTRFPKFLNGPDYMEWYKKAEELDNQYLVSQGKTPFALTYTDNDIKSVRNGTDTSGFYGNTDWVGKMVDNTSLDHYHSLSVSGGSDRIKYFTTLGYWNQNGVMSNTKYTRYNVRANLDAKISDIVSTNVDLSARMEDRQNPPVAAVDQGYQNPYILAVRMLPNVPMYGPGGQYVGGNTDAGIGNPLVAVNDIGSTKGETTTFNGNITMNINIPMVKGLQVKVLAGYDKAFTEGKTWVNLYTVALRNRVGSGWSWATGKISAYNVNRVIQSFAQSNRTTLQPSINYNRTFGQHAVSALVLYEYSAYNTTGFGAAAQNYVIDAIHDINFGSQAAADLRAATGSSSATRRGGYVGRINYGFREKYLAEVSARYDASVNFASNERWGLFPALSLGWVVSKEEFWKNGNTPVNFLKLKGSAGKMGNDRINPFQYLNTFQLRTTPIVAIGGQAVSSLYSNAPANPNITWEEANMYSGGFEMNLWNNALNINWEYFYKRTKNILTSQSGIFAPSVGGNFPSTVNAGMVDNRGIDMQVSHGQKFGKWSYTIIGNFTYAHNKILRIDDAVNAPLLQRRVGHSIGEKVGFVADGLFQTQQEVDNGPTFPYGVSAPGFVKYRDLNGDGQISFEQDRTFIAKSNTPEIQYGIDLQASYGVVDFSALFQGAARSDVALAGLYNSGVQSNTAYTQTFSGNGNSPYFLVEQSWRPDNPGGKYPRLTANKAGLTNQNGYTNSYFIRSGAYLRLKTLQIGVSLGAKALQKSKLQQWRFYIAGSNLLTWDKLKYVDPETPDVVQAGFYPQQRVITIGTNIIF